MTLSWLLLLPLATLGATLGTDDQIYADIDYGTFQNPSSQIRPKFRYWVNDGSANLSRIASDVREVGEAGAGGVELLAFFNYGESPGDGNTAPLQVDWVKYGYGTSYWKGVQDTVLQTAQEEGLVVDLAQGPNQGAGVPAPYNSEGLLVTLGYAAVNITVGGQFDGAVPGWSNNGSFMAATIGLVVNSNGSTSTLSAASLTDVTPQVSSDGSVSVRCPDDSSASTCTLFAFYNKFTEKREVSSPAEVEVAVPQSPIDTWEKNGSWAVDHWSEAGAQLIIDVWNETLLAGDSASLISQVGSYLWEDSQEYDIGILPWSSGIPAAFNKSRGYSIHKYLPLVLGTYVTDEVDQGESHVADYQQTLTDLNQIYLIKLSDWSNSLGIQFSAQVVYNLPMDMLANVPYVNAPECETLIFGHLIDGYRQYAGPANLAGKRVISSEAGAIYNISYQQPIYDMIWDIKRSIVGSVNQFVLHGLPYSGSYPNTSYPGFTTFGYAYSEQQGKRQPSWDFYSDWLGWLSRNLFATQSGRPLIDIAFYLKTTSNPSASGVPIQYYPTDLVDAGYNYEYLSPDNFALPGAVVSDGILAPDRQAFKALVVRSNDSLTSFGVEKLVEYANHGLPIIFVGGIPTKVFGHVSATECVSCPLNSTTSLPNVHVVPSEDLATSLRSLGILPRTAVSSNGTWYTYWRTDETTSTDYVVIYNDTPSLESSGARTSGTIIFETAGVPYFYDAWTGDTLELTNYTQSDNTTTVSLELADNQSIILGFHRDPSTLPESSGTLPSVALGNAQDLGNWTLTVESWTAPTGTFDPDVEFVTRTNLTAISVPTLAPWNELSEALTYVSGRGYYSTSFAWPPRPSDNSTATMNGAIIDFGYILHTIRATLNGVALPTLDLSWARANVTEYLRKGDNTLEVVVSTPLGNSLIPIWDELQTDGLPTKPEYRPTVAGYGLVNAVKVIPYTL